MKRVPCGSAMENDVTVELGDHEKNTRLVPPNRLFDFIRSMKATIFFFFSTFCATRAFAPARTSRQSFLTAPSSVLALSSTTASSQGATLPEGVIKTMAQEGIGPKVKRGDIATVKYACYVADQEFPFARSKKQKVVVGDGSMIPGWDAALASMTVGERSIIQIESDLAYGAKGAPPVVPPHASVQIDLEVLDSQPPNVNINFDDLANADNTPRTAADIAAAFEVRQAVLAQQGPKKEGLEGFLERAKSFYFFGLFEGETGEKAPWFLRPSITFPLAFLIVGAAFFVQFSVGGIKERGAQVTDELDEIILSAVSPEARAVLTLAALACQLPL